MMRLTRLARAEVAQMACARGPLDERDLEALYAATEGNPLFVGEMMRVLASEGHRQGGMLPLPDGVRAAIRTHLARLPPELRHHLDAAAVVGREFSATVLAAILDEPVRAVVAALGEGTAAGFLVERMPSRFAFAHGLFREVLHADLQGREEMHRRVAETLERMFEGDPTALAEIARHWLDAGPEASERAVSAARRAADVAERSLAYDVAADLHERALGAHEQAAPGDARGRAELLLVMADARIRAGQVKPGKEACEQAAAIARQLGDAQLLARAALGHGSDIVAGAIDRELASLLQEALRVVDASDAGLRARLLARLASAQQPAFDPHGPVALAHEAIGTLTGAEDRATRLAVLHNAMGAMVDFVDPRERRPLNEEVVRLAGELGERGVELRARLRLFHDHLECGDLVGAAARIDAYESAARAYPQPHVHFPTLLARSGLALLRGRFEESDRFVAEARSIADRTRDSWLQRAASMHEIISLRIRGLHDELARRRDELAPSLTVFRHYGAIYGIIPARHGDAAGARAALAQLDHEHVRVCLDTMLATWVAEAAAIAKDVEWGAIAEEVLAPLAGEWSSWSGVAYVVEGPVARARALAAVAREDAAAAEMHFASAVADAERAGARAVAGRIRAEQGELLGTRAPAGPPPSSHHSLTFVREGEYWTVDGVGATVHLKDSRGLQILASLVAEEGRELHVLDLASRGGEPGEVVDAGDSGELLDERARDAYRRRLAELTEELEEAEGRNDPGHAARARAEIEALKDELARAVGLGGRLRRSGRAAERARVNVQRRITEAIRRVGEADSALGEHLQKSVRTGAYCSYASDRARRRRDSA
jgi:hypothetical protein